MTRWIVAASWVSFAAITYLILGEAVARWIGLPILGNIGFTLVFVLFALFHCVALEGVARTGIFFGVSAVVSYVMEEVGVRSGLIYGAYHYSDLLGPKLGHVPVIIPLAWFMMIYPSWMVAKAMLRGIEGSALPGLTAQALVAAWVITGWDMVMDPGMALAGNWVWEHGGAYFGVPRRNYLGWLLTTFLVYWTAGWLWRNPSQRTVAGKTFAALPVIVYASFAARYVAANHFPELQVVAAFSMGVPALVALIQIFLRGERAAVEVHSSAAKSAADRR